MFDWKAFAESTYQDSFLRLDFNNPAQLELKKGNEIFPAEQILLEKIFDSRIRNIVIWGRPGSGKSFLLDSLNAKLTDDLRAEIENHEATQYSGDIYQPVSSTVVPILLRLRLFDSETIWSLEGELKLETILRQKLMLYGLTQSIPNFLRTGPQFILLIDDLDEVVRRNYSQNLHEVIKFIERYSFVKIVVAGRKIATRFLDDNRYLTFQICNLTRATVENWLTTQCQTPTRYLFEQFIVDESRFSVLSTPWFIRNAVDYWNNLSEPADNFYFGQMLGKLFNDIVYRQIQTEHSNDAEGILRDRVLVLQKLAYDLMLKGRHSLTSTEIRDISSDDLQWFQHMEFLIPSQTYPDFASRWIQALFAAQHVANEFTSFEKRLACLVGHLDQLDSVKSVFLSILTEITQENYSSLISKNEKLVRKFSELEIKLLSLNFELAVYQYYQNVLKCKDVRQSVKEPFLGNDEVDIYAIKDRHEQHIDIFVVECKYRLPPYPAKSLKHEEIDQLLRVWQKVQQVEQDAIRGRSETKTVHAVLITNGGQYPDEVLEKAKQHKVEIWEADLPFEKFMQGKYKLSKEKMRRIL